jgi:hypothetical protein
LIEPISPTQREKRKRFIRLLCKVKGESEYDEKKPVNENIVVSVDDIKLVVKTVAGIDLNVKE